MVSEPVPTVHGRKTGSNGNLNLGSGVNRRLANHQRNLSLDFRSMGILLPPVSQVTSCHSILSSTNSAFSTVNNSNLGYVAPVHPPGYSLSIYTGTSNASTSGLIHHQQHHQRNRSLDSVLQRIPEVDITPSPTDPPPADHTPIHGHPPLRVWP